MTDITLSNTISYKIHSYQPKLVPGVFRETPLRRNPRSAAKKSGNNPMAKSTKLDLETTFSQLETTIDKLEDEQASLQESLNAFEQGIKLTRKAQQTLLEAEQKVKLLLEEAGEPETRDFSDGNAE